MRTKSIMTKFSKSLTLEKAKRLIRQQEAAREKIQCSRVQEHLRTVLTMCQETAARNQKAI